MNAQQLYESGRLDDAIRAAGDTLRDDPGNVRLRTFLFELLCFAGDFERAEKQLDVVAASSQEASMGASLYRSAIHAERIRQETFRSAPAAQPAVEARPVAGTLNGKSFESLTDADPRIGARLEVFAAGQYTWVPYSHIASVRMEAPKRLRDLLWINTSVLAGPGFSDFDFGEVLVPVLSPLAGQDPRDEVRLGRLTEWEETDGGGAIPIGQKLLLVDDEYVPILEVRELVITAPEQL